LSYFDAHERGIFLGATLAAQRHSMVAVGIDLGTTNSCVAVWRDGAVEVVANAQGHRTTPSRMLPGTERVGDAATGPEAVYDVKRLMGRQLAEVPAAQRALWPFTVAADATGGAVVQRQGRTWTPVELSALVLRELRAVASAYLGEEVTQAVLTVPAYFTHAQRQATQAAGEAAGLEVLRLINEPTAAALAYGVQQAAAQRILVFDWGGGTLDVSILQLEAGLFTVKATAGDSQLGGQDLDALLVAHCAPHPGGARQRLRKACESVKRQLSAATKGIVLVEAFADGADLTMPLSRAKLEAVAAPLWERLLRPVEAAVAASPEPVDSIVLVGGSTRIPKVRQLLSERFPGVPLTTQGIHPEEAVACGAALQASLLTGACPGKLLLLDVTPISLGIETQGGVHTCIIPRNTTIPCRIQHRFSTYYDRQPSVKVRVLEGERRRAQECHELGTFELGPLPLLPQGEPQVAVTLAVDASGLLDVTATEGALSHTLTVQASHHASPPMPPALAASEQSWAADVAARQQLQAALSCIQRALPARRKTHMRVPLADVAAACEETRRWLAQQPRTAAACRATQERLQQQFQAVPMASAARH
jgi:heat shock 70kDa protein 1/2/6/8